MGDSKHTPGPWEIVIGAGSKGYAGSYEIITAIDGEHESNAHLIAAAPELLKACELGEAVLRDLLKAIVPAQYVDTPRIGDALAAFHAAISKTKGEP